MRICAISDIHGYLPEDLPKCDILCICGDISPLPIQRYSKSMHKWLENEFSYWVDNIPSEYVVMIPGNHDLFLERHPEWIEFVNELQIKLTILNDSSITIGGKLFYGTSWCPELKNWAFYGDSNTLHSKYNLIPNNVDVLLTHCPPKIGNAGVVLQENCFNTGTDYGSTELLDSIQDKSIDYILCGHIHSGDHNFKQFGNSKIANVSLVDEYYNIAYKPLVFDI